MKPLLLFCLTLTLWATVIKTQISHAQTQPDHANLDLTGFENLQGLEATSLQLQFAPTTLQLTAQETGHMQLALTKDSSLYAFDIAIIYNSQAVTVIDADSQQAGVQVALGSALSGKKLFMAENQVSDGVIRLAGTLLSPEQPLTAEGNLFDINWQAQNSGQSTLTINRAILITQDNTRLEIITSTGQIDIGAPMTLMGQAQRQGRADQAGITVTTTQQIVQTDANGQFTVQGFNPYRLNFNATGYLSAWLEGTTSDGSVGTVTLLGGEVTGDDAVDIFDLAFIGSRYQSQDNQADLTGDGQVNIFDLALAAGNYGKSGPIYIKK